MTTDTPAAPAAWTAWRDMAMELADDYADACDLDGGRGGIGTERYNAARAALAEHLDAVPMGEPVGEFWRPDPELGTFYVYRHPKESA